MFLQKKNQNTLTYVSGGLPAIFSTVLDSFEGVSSGTCLPVQSFFTFDVVSSEHVLNN